MKSYPTYDALAVDLDLHFFDKISILCQIGNRLRDGKWFVVTDDGQCHLFDKDGNLDDIRKLCALKENYISRDIKKIIIPDSVTSIEVWAFWGYPYLTSMIISDSVTRIGDWALEHCDSLADVTIGNSVINIGSQVFYFCKNLKSVFFKGKTLKQVKAMENYPWGIRDESIIKAELE